MSDRLPPCDHDECPKTRCVQTCVTYTVQRDGRASCVYLHDGTKITVERDATTKGPAWLKVSQQAMIYAQSQTPKQTTAMPLTKPTWTNEQVRMAVHESCSCGGRGPDDGCCPACEVWHRLQGRTVKQPSGPSRADKLDALCREMILMVDPDDPRFNRADSNRLRQIVALWEKRRKEANDR